LTWKIDDIVITGKAVLASMTKITDLPFRLVCRELGADLAFTAMVNCNAVSRGNKAARKIYYTVPEDAPLGIQLFGSRPDKFCKQPR
jgi:tRNA-dihydrouridine synthase